jgi:DNA helicase-2/ATP-dependent DNA helicase PcrA
MSADVKIELSAEQKKALDDPSRLRVVRAGPGTGKTSLFVAAIEKVILEHKFEKHQGISAITFTRVARGEIERRLGSMISHPHFIGTLDAFALRFIVKPFGKVVGLRKSGIKLIPDSRTRDTKLFPVVVEKVKSAGGMRPVNVSLLKIDFVGGTEENPILEYYCEIRRLRRRVEDSFVKNIMDKKRALWASAGLITHSDCQFLASCILRNSTLGNEIRATITNRFPYFFVDEVQDTGWFLSRMLLKLIEPETVCGFAVGDPDQAIYEFSGSNPEIFESLEKLRGANCHSLTETYRCSKRVSQVTSIMSSTGAKVMPFPAAGDGRVIIGYYTGRNHHWSERMQRLLMSHVAGGKSYSILARKKETIYSLKGKNFIETPNPFSSSSKLIFQAEVALKRGESARARSIIEHVIAEVVFGHEGSIDDSVLERFKITPIRWRQHVWNVLYQCSKVVNGESWNAWQTRVRDKIVEEFGGNSLAIGLAEINKGFLKYKSNDSQAKAAVTIEKSAKLVEDTYFSTVHGVKGEEFDCVVLFCPVPTGNKCPSKQWWDDMEERKVAFVASSRARETFILLVHQKTFEALRSQRKEFFDLFENIGSIETLPE